MSDSYIWISVATYNPAVTEYTTGLSLPEVAPAVLYQNPLDKSIVEFSGFTHADGVVTIPAGTIPDGAIITFVKRDSEVKAATFSTGGPISATAISAAVDRNFNLVTQLRDIFDKYVFMIREGDEYHALKNNRANKVLAFDADGNVSFDMDKTQLSTDKDNAEQAAAEATASAAAATTSASAASASADSAATQAQSAIQAANSAGEFYNEAHDARNEALDAQAGAETAQQAAETAQSGAETAQAAAESAAATAASDAEAAVQGMIENGGGGGASDVDVFFLNALSSGVN